MLAQHAGHVLHPHEVRRAGEAFAPDRVRRGFERQKVQSLIDDEITELAWLGKKIEQHYGRPMDIEWAIDKDMPAGGNVFILQARPETVWSTRPQSGASSPARSAMDYILSAMLTGKKVG